MVKDRLNGSYTKTLKKQVVKQQQQRSPIVASKLFIPSSDGDPISYEIQFLKVRWTCCGSHYSVFIKVHCYERALYF